MTDGPVVVLSQRLGAVTAEEKRLAALGARVRSAPLGTLDLIAENAAGADMIILGAVEPFGAAALRALPRLQAVARRGVGVDNVDLDVATRLGILVANVPDATVEEVSDHALACLLGLERRLTPINRMTHDGVWTSDPASLQKMRVKARRFCDLTLGVIGFGRIGTAMCRKAAPVYSRVLVFDVVPQSAERLCGAQAVPLEELLASADHLSLHMPMSVGNRHLIGPNEIASMPAGAVLVNTARGGLVDEAAIVHALRSGHLAGAALDVTEAEPVDLNGVLAAHDIADRLLLTAHSAAWSRAASVALAVRSVDAVAALIAGTLPDSVVNPEVLKSPTLRWRGGGKGVAR